MCGISGIVNFNSASVSTAEIEKMMAAIKHRGQDDEGSFIDESVGLGFVRLSILDLSVMGHQPMLSSEERFVIIFNGEIFNYIELREELEKEGYIFKTNTDTEVLLNAFIKWGRSCLDKLNGMWAFVIYDRLEKELFGARDRFGIKPFYYFRDNEQFVFASEIPAILSVLKKKPEANSKSIFEYLVFNRTDQDEDTFFKGIKKLNHGHCFTIKNNEIIIKKWYDLKENLKQPFKDPTKYREMLTDSIKLRLRSDVPVGVCFSGGLDSSAILSIIAKENKEINTFSAVYNKGDEGDETSFIKLYDKEIKNMHFISPSAENLFSDLNELIKTHAEPIPDTSPYAQFKVMKLAKENVTVTLDGQGADEQLGGYHYFFGLYYKELLKKFKFLKLIKELAAFKNKHHSNFGFKTFIFFLLPPFLRTKLRAIRRGYINENFFSKNHDNSSVSESLYGSNSLKEALLDHFEYKLEHLLKWEDRNSMRFSIEARVPFLDHRLVERTLSLNNNMIINNGITKVILRESMKGLIPEQIRMRQDKIGFGTPEGEWFRKDYFKEFILNILNSASFKNRNIIDPNKAINMYQKHLNHEVEISKEIWKWINLELWFREFID